MIVKRPLLFFLSLTIVFFMAGCGLPSSSSYTVTYDGNGAVEGSVPVDANTYNKGDLVIVMDDGTLVRNGFIFNGWSADTAGSGALYDPGDTFAMESADVILYAIWNPVPFSVLGDARTVSLADFNDTYIYSIITADPTGKPESNGAPATQYSYTVKTTAASVIDVPQSSGHRRAEALSKSIGVSAQARKDLLSRDMENLLLSSDDRHAEWKAAAKAKAVPASISVGTLWNGVYISQADSSITTVNTTCRYISERAYFFVDNRDILLMEAYLVDYGAAFDAIYLVNRQKFGQENDTDLNGKIVVVFTRAITDNLLGYFWAVDKFPNVPATSTSAGNPYSNEGDIFYLTTDAYAQGADDGEILGTLAHEFQHMIYFDEHYDRGASGSYSWLNEALSQAAEYYNGYQAGQMSWINSFLLDYGVGLSLTHWTSENYGYGAVFMQYLIDRFGDAAVKNMCATNLIGIDAVEAATGADFNELFTDFTRAIVMSGTGDSTDPKYTFTTLDLVAAQPTGRGGLLPWDPTPPFEAGDSDTFWVYPYSLEFIRWHGTFGTMKLSGTDTSGTAFGLSR